MKKILVVEDLKENVLAAKEAMSALNIELDLASNYEEAINLAKDEVYYLAILDLHFPTKEAGEAEQLGFKLANQLHDQFLLNSIILTGGMDHHGDIGEKAVYRVKGRSTIWWLGHYEKYADDKSLPSAWIEAFQILVKNEGEETLDHIYRSLLRRKKSR